MKYIKLFNESKSNLKFKKIIIDDFVIYQGKDANSNDYVTFILGDDDDDIWLHAKGVPGSHVIIKIRDRFPTDEIIKKAAKIAAENCKSKENEIVVLYCKKKFVSKPSNSAPGKVKVDYKNSNEIKIKIKNNI